MENDERQRQFINPVGLTAADLALIEDLRRGWERIVILRLRRNLRSLAHLTSCGPRARKTWPPISLEGRGYSAMSYISSISPWPSRIGTTRSTRTVVPARARQDPRVGIQLQQRARSGNRCIGRRGVNHRLDCESRTQCTGGVAP